MKAAIAICIAIMLFAGAVSIATGGGYQKIVRKPEKKPASDKKKNPPATNSNTQPTPSDAGKQEHPELETYTETVSGVAIEMVRAPAGRFQMGSPRGEARRYDDERPQHEVSMSSFYIGKYEVTQAQWRAVAGLPKVKRDLDPDPSNFKGDNLPVEKVSGEEAIEFCDRVSMATRKTYRLPTEAEWEYACRSGTKGPYAGNLDSMAWYDNNSGSKTHAVGTKRPNRFGLYDMHGNVWEWCMDWYSENYYRESTRVDPTGPSTGSYQVARGGSWTDLAQYCRSALRYWDTPDYRIFDLGFRLVRTLR